MKKYIVSIMLFFMTMVAFSQLTPIQESTVIYRQTMTLDSLNATNIKSDSLYIKLPLQSFVCDSVAYVMEVTENVDKSLPAWRNDTAVASVNWTSRDTVVKYNALGRDSIGAILKVQLVTPEHQSDSTTYWTWPTVLTKAVTGNTGVIWGSNVKSSFPWPKIFGYVQGWVYNASGHRKRTITVTIYQIKLTWRKV